MFFKLVLTLPVDISYTGLEAYIAT